MPDLDLGPDDYKIRDPRTGRWHVPANPKLAGALGIVLIGVLIFLFIRRDEMTSETLFGVVAMFSLFAGGLLGLSARKSY
ncbi:MAG: hypothetical protein JWR51_4703 [Devosia sp.]|uniref:hypothetical protein n=1 Tax=Devosia sp. TaxID=1871048 RepID=UPI002621C1B5|nr:hypothetical protein [Devosia sp.]MDB5531600.1 hypothetical protein [Devosia sp.]